MWVVGTLVIVVGTVIAMALLDAGGVDPVGGSLSGLGVAVAAAGGVIAFVIWSLWCCAAARRQGHGR